MRIGFFGLLGVAALAVGCDDERLSVGGEVAGLRGGGLRLLNNGGDALAVGANGRFTFDTELKDGTPYAVTVDTQPINPRQTCGVQNGAGTLAGVRVTGVRVNCATNTYTVGGTLTGVGTGVTLQLNGGESLARTADGPFLFTTKVEDQGAYAVSVTAMPDEVDCAVAGGTGTMDGANVGSVQVSCAPRRYKLGGSVQGLTGTLVLGLEGAETLSVTADGPFEFQTRLTRGTAYSVGVSTQPQGQRCTVANGSGSVAGDVESISVRCYPYFDLDNHQVAEVVIGQKDFTSNAVHQGGGAGANTLNGPWANPVLADGRFYVSDQGSNRILGFNGVPAANDAAAGFVLGQSAFTTTAAGGGQGGLNGQAGLSSDGPRLAVADTSNNRVLLYTALPASTGAQPTLVLGQLDFTNINEGCTRSALTLPEGVFVGHGKLIVADTRNHRVLVWNSIPAQSGALADLVLGQGSFVTCAANDTNGDGAAESAPSNSTLFIPTAVWTDGTRLVVADQGNHRVLIWSQFPTRDAQPADLVLGQSGFQTRGTATTATGMNSPFSVASNGLQLFVVESGNHRVLVWNQFPTANGQAADKVLGQPDFVTGTSASPTDRNLLGPRGVLLAWPHVLVTDSGNNRLLLFRSR